MSQDFTRELRAAANRCSFCRRRLDQNAAHEKSHSGTPICPRLDAAVDFIVVDEDMLDVGQ